MVRTELAGVLALSLLACGSNDSAREESSAFSSDRISVIATGDGPDIILIPGLASHRDAWAGVVPSLDDDYRVHLVQVNGFAGFDAGANATGPILEPVTFEITRYIRESGLERPALIGHSMGGTLAMMVAARQTDVAGRVMVVDNLPFMGPIFGSPHATVDSVRPVAEQMRTQILEGQLLQQMFATMARSDSANRVILSQAEASNRRTVADALYETMVTDLRPELPQIRGPITVLYVVPANAPLPPDQFEQALRQTYANAAGARIVRVDSSNHFIQIDQPARFVAEVRAFMQR